MSRLHDAVVWLCSQTPKTPAALSSPIRYRSGMHSSMASRKENSTTFLAPSLSDSALHVYSRTKGAPRRDSSRGTHLRAHFGSLQFPAKSCFMGLNLSYFRVQMTGASLAYKRSPAHDTHYDPVRKMHVVGQICHNAARPARIPNP